MGPAGIIECPWPSGWEPDGDGPCAPWPINPNCCPGWPCSVEDFEPRHWIAIAIASERLWRATGGRFGLCREYVRPCKRECDGWNRVFKGTWGIEGPIGGMSGRWGNSWMGGWPGGGALLPLNLGGGNWVNASCGTCKGDCSCIELCEILLPGPVACIIEVKWDGQIVDPASYTVFPPNRLIRRGVSAGGCGCETPAGCQGCQPCWPKCQRLDLCDTEPCTFSVLYERGIPVPPGGILAASRLACQIAQSCGPVSGDCEIPTNATTIVREGITYTLQAPNLEAGEPFMSGIPEVDEWVALVNPHALKQPSAVFSPDFPAAPTAWRVGRSAPGGGGYGW